MYTTDTICAIATAERGAIGIVRISGNDAITAADRIFTPKHGKPLRERAANSVVFGIISDDDDEIIDEVLATVFRVPHSYTGEDSVELACHGSRYILNKVLELLLKNGCRMANPGEYTQRAYLNGKMDLSQAEAVADLIASNSRASHRIAMNQMRGGISNKLADLRTKLLHLTSLLELELDFSDHEDLAFADRTELKNLTEEIVTEIERLTANFKHGNALKNGISVAIIGAPNVGKSTLLNALLRDSRAIVSNIGGTTRDLIEDTREIDGVLFRFIDTAGLRETDDEIEQMGIERSVQAAKKAQIILLVTEPEVAYPIIETDEEQIVIKILNKTDDFQALHGIGIEWLETELIKAVPKINDDNVLITNLRHKQALENAYEAISRAKISIIHDISPDLVAEDLRLCVSYLGEIVGKINSDDILQNIFSHFCVGK